jgi:hypothetical protein
MLQTWRWAIKKITGAASVPPSSSHKNGDWTANDIYIGELALDPATETVYSRSNDGIFQVGSGEGAIKIAKIRIPAADVLTSNATPITLIPVPSGTKTGIFIMQAAVGMDAGTEYATNTDVAIYYNTATENYATVTGFLSNSGASATYLTPFQANTDLNAVFGQSVRFRTLGGNPTGGNRDVLVYIAYIVIDQTV